MEKVLLSLDYKKEGMKVLHLFCFFFNCVCKTIEFHKSQIATLQILQDR